MTFLSAVLSNILICSASSIAENILYVRTNGIFNIILYKSAISSIPDKNTRISLRSCSSPFFMIFLIVRNASMI
ncbi:hypothetical protein ECANGB1_2607 [Enterospora canceri]|uniref:Secreted protein n=1 Tax=Enterospora canceri TaxID=1081671 RepID=A0A1Y1S9L6_9MICR|nr:hypothetical protein ECANGB1_2607 [Enterospora canceri]